MPRGATSATVVDYYSPEQTLGNYPSRSTPLTHDNAQVYFKRSRKAQHGLVKVQELLTQCAADEQYLEGVAQQVEQAEDWETLEAVACGTRCLALSTWDATSCGGPDASSVAIPDVRIT